MKYTKEWAIEAVKQGATVYPFYGHVQKGEFVDASCLSQWFPCRFTVDGVAYTTAEQFMMAEKARLFGDEEYRRLIFQADDPKICKQLGRKVRGFQAETWNAHNVDIVTQGNIAKFSQNPEMKAFLLGTGNAILVEASPRDRIWGIGMGKSNPNVQNPAAWRGRNLLGFSLMEVRDQLKG